MRSVITRLLKAYKYLISPLLGNQCRFYPSCSDYAIQSVETHGVGKGLLLSTKRICRCNPWSAGGFDPVPGCEHEQQNERNG